MSMLPYYQTPDRAVTVYHAPWRDVWPLLDPSKVGIIHADPPYIPGFDTDNSKRTRSPAGKTNKKSKAFPGIQNPTKPFDPRPILKLAKPTVLWSANYYPRHLPPSATWLQWLKRGLGPDGKLQSDDGSDSELAWTNFAKFPNGSLRCLPHVWRGLCRASEATAGGNRTIHPTQKPEKLCEWVFLQAVSRGVLKPGQTIFVPYGGSMPEIRPAMALGCPIVLCETELQYVQDAIALRLGAGQGSGAGAEHDAHIDPRQARLFE